MGFCGVIGVVEGICVIPKVVRGKRQEVLWWSSRGETYIFRLGAF